ncbi:hypothetical protein Salat_0146600 [Sesamum alatum]|uniref:Uncharacterized protein n=1 Tax=Sesamum alatum TaxID=300844 RepID=A0AAE2CXK4_9LAMI|nr:hypothetical protein Salat_0146600 [Sesamum alatum]
MSTCDDAHEPPSFPTHTPHSDNNLPSTQIPPSDNDLPYTTPDQPIDLAPSPTLPPLDCVTAAPPPDPSAPIRRSSRYTLDIIQDAGLMGCKAASTPFPQGLKLCNDCGEPLAKPDQYRRLVGQLLYLSFTRLNITHCFSSSATRLVRFDCSEV